jgi:hypothetical protein
VKLLAGFFEKKACENSQLNDSPIGDKSSRSAESNIIINKSPQIARQLNSTTTAFNLEECEYLGRASVPNIGETIFDQKVICDIERVKSKSISGIIEVYEKTINEKKEIRKSKEKVKEASQKKDHCETIYETNENICFKSRFKRSLRKFKTSNCESSRVGIKKENNLSHNRSMKSVKLINKLDNSDDKYSDSVEEVGSNVSDKNVHYNIVVKNEIQSNVNVYNNIIINQDTKPKQEVMEKNITAEDILECFKEIQMTIDVLNKKNLTKLDQYYKIYPNKGIKCFFCLFFVFYRNTTLNNLFSKYNINK